MGRREGRTPQRRDTAAARGRGPGKAGLFTGLILGLTMGIVLAAALAWYLNMGDWGHAKTARVDPVPVSDKTPLLPRESSSDSMKTPLPEDVSAPNAPAPPHPEQIKTSPPQPSIAPPISKPVPRPPEPAKSTPRAEPKPRPATAAKTPHPTAAAAPQPPVKYTFYRILPGDKPAQPIEPPPPKEVWWLQIAALSDPARAEQIRSKLTQIKLPAQVQKIESNGQLLYRIRVGPYTREDDAFGDLDILTENNFYARLLKEAAAPQP